MEAQQRQSRPVSNGVGWRAAEVSTQQCTGAFLGCRLSPIEGSSRVQLKQRKVAYRHALEVLGTVEGIRGGGPKRGSGATAEGDAAMARCRELLLRYLRCLVEEQLLLRDVAEEEAWADGAEERAAERYPLR